MSEMVFGRDKAKVTEMTMADMPFVIDKLLEEVPKLPHYRGLRMDRDRIEFFVKQYLESKDESAFWARLLRAPDGTVVGGCAGYCVTMLLSWDKMTSDIFLYIEPQWRSLNNVVKLQTAYKEWAKRRGAKIIQATHTGGYRKEVMDRMLETIGFKPIGTIYYLGDVK